MVRRHFFLFAALGALALMLIAGGLRLALPGAGANKSAAGGPGGRGNAVLVASAKATTRSFVDKVDVLGVAKGLQSVTISASATELVTAVRFKDGARVRKGQVLVDLKAQEQSAAIDQAQASLDLANINYRRWKTLGDQGIAASSSVDQYRVAMQQAEANLAAAKSRMGDRVIQAPFSGVVGLSDIAPGALINPGAPIVSLDDVSVIRVDFDVPDRYLPSLRQGEPITARTDAYPDRIEHGRIAMIDTRIDLKTRSIKARAEFPNPEGRLKPGMLVHVQVDQGQRQALAAPEAAVQYEGDQAFVFVLARRGDGWVAQERQVQTGADEGGFIEIKDGLKPGEPIVADGVNRLAANQPVRLDAGSGGGRPKARAPG